MENGGQPAKRIMGVFAHPDDPEFFCGAAFARWAAEGAQVTFVLATSGDKGSDDPEMTHERLVAIREDEERRAAEVLGVRDVVFLRYPDGELQPTLELRRDIARLVRIRKPDIVVTNDPTVYWYDDNYVNHPDHRAIGQATLDAIFPGAGNRLYHIEMVRDEGLQPHKIKQLYIVGALHPTKKVDVSAYLDAQVAALREHKSQIKDLDSMPERIREWKRDPESPDDSPRYIDSFKVMTFE